MLLLFMLIGNQHSFTCEVCFNWEDIDLQVSFLFTFHP